jgi:hypothetical protein
MLVALSTSQPAEWSQAVRACIAHDFYHTCDYHRIAERLGEGEAQLLVYRQDDHQICLPILVRPIPVDLSRRGLSDATSVYGYAGPIASADPPPAVIAGFAEAVTGWLRERQVVSVFSRLHPLIPEQEGLLSGLGQVLDCGPTVSIDLSASDEEAFAHYRKDHRNGIRRLRRSGVTCTVDTEGHWLDEFVRIYHETMQRVGARERYLFPRDYFEAMLRCDDFQTVLIVCQTDHPVCAGMFTLCGGISQAHLSGTLTDCLSLSPRRLMVDTARSWAKAAGARVLHLGGGVGSQRDSLFDFKAGFSQDTNTFRTLQWVVDGQEYSDLLSRSRQLGNRNQPGDYFPLYRAGA